MRHRFLGAATPNGAVDFIPNLSEDIPKRYFMKGRPGSGKSAMLKKLAAAAVERGIDVEVYHCGLDPNSLDMLIFRELGMPIFDSTAPHEYFPSRDGDEIIDLYELLISPGATETNTDRLRKISSDYKGIMPKATSFLARAKELNDELEAIYISAMDFSIVDTNRETIEEEVKALSKAPQ